MINLNKIKANKKTIGFIILIIVLVNMINIFFSSLISTRALNYQDIHIKTTIPNAYISKSYGDIGFLGGRNNYTITKIIGNKTFAIEYRQSKFGLGATRTTEMRQNRQSYSGEEWTNSYWENGYRKMLFFHPEINYTIYRNDLQELEHIEKDKLVEVAVSFDNSYKIEEVERILEGFNVSWLWVDHYGEEQMKEWQNDVLEYDGTSTYILEGETFGTFIRDSDWGLKNLFYNQYQQDMNKIKKYDKRLYNQIAQKGIENVEDAELLGAVIYGDVDQLKSLEDIEEITAITLGCIVPKY